MKRLTAKFHIAIGQTALLVSLILVALYLVLILLGWPDMLVAGLGMVEQWSGRAHPPAGGGGSAGTGPGTSKT